MNVEHLEVEALRLHPRERARLAERLLQSLSAPVDDENERLWVDEAVARDEDLDAGAAMARPAADVFRDARSRLG